VPKVPKVNGGKNTKYQTLSTKYMVSAKNEKIRLDAAPADRNATRRRVIFIQ
jgi:hypothetical protein